MSPQFVLTGALWFETLERRPGLHLASTVSHFLILLKMSKQIWCVGRKATLVLSKEEDAVTLCQLSLINHTLSSGLQETLMLSEWPGCEEKQGDEEKV